MDFDKKKLPIDGKGRSDSKYKKNNLLILFKKTKLKGKLIKKNY